MAQYRPTTNHERRLSHTMGRIGVDFARDNFPRHYIRGEITEIAKNNHSITALEAAREIMEYELGLF